MKPVSRSQARWRNTRLRCGCGGYAFPHRMGGGACEYSPRRDFYRAVRQGLPVEEAMLLLSVEQLERMFPYAENELRQDS